MNPTSFETSALEVMELRQYTLHPHKRDVLIDLFDREFLETQDAVGMPVLGQFRDLDDPDRFVWMRGFANMQRRHEALSAFYGGPVWQAHRDAANATMIDSDNVLLLRPAWLEAGFPMDLALRPDMSAVKAPPGFVDVTMFHLKQAASDELLAFCRAHMSRVLREGGAVCQGWYCDETGENTFTRLPVRTGEHLLVGIALFKNAQAFEAFGASKIWQQQIAPQLHSHFMSTQSLRLTPTARSALHA
jgi:NIPSNAP